MYRQDCEVDPKELGLRHNVVGCKLVLEMYFYAKERLRVEFFEKQPHR